jgi:hypothetical protein
MIAGMKAAIRCWVLWDRAERVGFDLIQTSLFGDISTARTSRRSSDASAKTTRFANPQVATNSFLGTGNEKMTRLAAKVVLPGRRLP